MNPMRESGLRNRADVQTARLSASILILAFAGSWTSQAVLPVPQKEEHCGVASLATLLPIVGGADAAESQDALAVQHNARIPEFHERRPQGAPPMQYYPEYRFTFQPILAEMLIDRGYCVISTRSMMDWESGKPKEIVVRILEDMLDAGRLGLVSFDTHYMAVTGYDRPLRRIRFADPLRPTQPFATGFEIFTDGMTRWHATPDGLPFDPWYGRMLFFWKPESAAERDLNLPGVCPYCRKPEPDTDRVYCRECGVYIERRTERGLYRALDTVALTALDHVQTRLEPDRVRVAGANAVATGALTESDWRTGLTYYPLAPRRDEPMPYIASVAKLHGVRVQSISTAGLESIVCSSEKWPSALADAR